MDTEQSSAPAQPGPSPRRWLQALLYTAATVMILVGGISLIWNRLIVPAGSGVTGEIMPGLESVGHVEAAHGALRDWNVLIVTFDTTRADHLGCYGNRAIETPTLDRLAREGILFANAATPVPATLPAHSSLLTGLYPYNHGARANGSFKLEDRNLTLAEILRDRGYRTAAAISAYVLDSTYGLAQGFELYHDDLTRGVKHAPQMFRERPAELTNEPVFDWLRRHADERFFCWVHYFDPHAVYLPPEPFRSRYAENLYDGEIAYADHQLGELLNLLSELGVRDKTLVVMTSDHGEGLGEHGEQTHSLLIYDATVHVPLIMHAPGALPEGKVIERQVSLADVVPTILDLLAVDPPSDFDGISLLQLASDEHRACYIETLASKTLHGWAPLLGVRRRDYKFILAPRPEVYDLHNDPHELENLYEARPDVAVDLHELLKGFVGDDPLLAAEVEENLEMDDEALRKLAALGYVMTATKQDRDADSPIDPKDGILLWERVQKGTNQRNAGDIKGAIETLKACLQETPGNVWAMQILAGAYQTAGKYEDARKLLEEAAKLSPSDPAVLLAIAATHLQLRSIDRAEERIRQVLAIHPDHSGAYLQLARVALSHHDDDEALRLMNKALELDRGSRKAVILCSLADLHVRCGRTEEAREAFGGALDVDAFNGEAHAGLAEILVSQGKEKDALEHLQEAVRFNPVQPRALAVLGALHSNRGEYETAIKCCRRAIEIRPNFAPAYVNLGLAHRRKGNLDKAEEIYRKGIELSPNYDALHQNLAQVLYRMGRSQEAFEEFKNAAKLNPYNAVAMANVGVFHMRAARYELARRCFRLALRVKPDDAFAHKHLGVLLLREGRIARGVSHLEKSLELEPNQPDAGKIRFQLESFRTMATTQPSEQPPPQDEKIDLNEILGDSPEPESAP